MEFENFTSIKVGPQGIFEKLTYKKRLFSKLHYIVPLFQLINFRLQMKGLDDLDRWGSV